MNAYALKSMLKNEHIYTILDQLGANGIKRDSNGFRSSCPIHKSNSNTVFVYNPDLHLYNCYGECNIDEKDGDIITLVKHCQKCTFDDAVKLICEWVDIDIKLIQDSEEYLLEELKNKFDSLLLEAKELESEMLLEFPYGVKPLDEEILSPIIGKKDEEGFIDSQGFKKSTLELFESAYNDKEKRWLLPQRSPDGLLLGFDGRDITNTSKSKWKKRNGLLTNKLLGRLDIVKNYIKEENKIILCEGKKDQMAIYEADLKHVTCIYGSSLSSYQFNIIEGLISDEIIIAPDGDRAGYKMVQSIIKKAYPEFLITVLPIGDGYDPADLSKKYLLELYENRIIVEEWLKIYEYRKQK